MRLPIRLAILEADTPLPKTRASYGGYGGVFQALLEAGAKLQGKADLNAEVAITKYQIEDNPEVYPQLKDIDAVLITGSRHDAFADTPWINKLTAFTSSCLASNHIRTIGVCFGHQIVGRALGVKVGRNDVWEAAVHDINLTPKGKEIFGKQSLSLHQMHRDIVFTYPDHVEQLGSSLACKVQGMYIAKHLLTVQGHPEFNEEIMREILDTRLESGVFNEEAYKSHIVKVDLPHDGLTVAKAFLNFLTE